MQGFKLSDQGTLVIATDQRTLAADAYCAWDASGSQPGDTDQ